MRRFTVYDSLTRESRLFVPLVPPKVGLFVCGLTQYADAHIGHAKTAVTFDLVARALRHWGYRVFYVQNVTNIDDRLIARGGMEGVDPLVLADRHFMAWQLAMGRLGATSANYYPHATDYIPEIIAQVSQLVAGGFAYESMGSVYYDVAKFPAYGKLSGQRTEASRPGTRIEPEPGKRAAEDFVLWKAATPGEPTWERPWGPGRPGWHIEDTAITVRLLGPRYDIHGGGLDLKFPHHEAEIAQAEAATGESPLVNYWMHAGLLTLSGEKMAKSVGNIVGLNESIDRYGPMPLRLYYLNVHYRSPLDYVPGKSLEEAVEAYERLMQPWRPLAAELEAAGLDRPGSELPEDVAEASNDALATMDDSLADDFNSRESLARLFTYGRGLVEWTHRLESLSSTALIQLAAPFRWAEEVLGIGLEATASALAARVAPVVEVALDARRRARSRGDYAEADAIRAALLSAGIAVEDHGERATWRVVPPTKP
ncbi:MAG TPA: cysteine--tRNA ligase [Thermoplasmata archaeon]|nr:cysteine--tRNA ligase [Thermoplasmata archaeon]